MRFCGVDQVEPRAHLVICTVMARPGLTENLSAEAADVFLLRIDVVELGIGLPLRNLESMRRRSQTDDRSAAIEIVGDMLHLLVRQIAKTKEDDH